MREVEPLNLGGGSLWTRPPVGRFPLGLVLITAVLGYLCFLLSRPLLPALAWALTLAVIAYPIHRRLLQRLRQPNLAAALAVAIVALVILLPAVFVLNRLIVEMALSLERLQTDAASGRWDDFPERNPLLAALGQWVSENVSIRNEVERLITLTLVQMPSLLLSALWVLLEVLTVLFALFYFFRDRDSVLELVRSVLPLTDREADDVFRRVGDILHATVYGTLLCAAVQGALGGLMFYWLGLPNPTLWGLIMGLLAIVPYLGAFVIWAPAAAFLAFDGDWGKALILIVWGGVAIALIDNYIYPILVGRRMRLHSLPVFVAVMGGLVIFGASGVIFGPVVLAVTDAVLHIWRQRRAGMLESQNRPAAPPTASGNGAPTDSPAAAASQPAVPAGEGGKS